MKSDNSQAFHDELRARIIAVGQRKAARESGIARRTLARFLEGKKVRKKVLAKIAAGLR